MPCCQECSNLPYFFSALAQSIAAIIAFSIAAIIFYKKRVEEQFGYNIDFWIQLNKSFTNSESVRTYPELYRDASETSQY